MDEEKNRLAWGRVREELPASLPEYNANLDRLRDQILKYRMVYLQKGGATPKQEAMVKRTLRATLDEQIVFHRDKLTVNTRPATKPVTLDTAFVWAPMEMIYERHNGEILGDTEVQDLSGRRRPFKGFKERTLQLGFQRHLVMKTKMFLNIIYQRVGLSEHALYRMVDRGVCDKAPLAHFSSKIDEWLPYVNALALVGAKGGFIPFAEGGLVIQTYAVVEPNTFAPGMWDLFDRFSMSCEPHGFHVEGMEPPGVTNRKHPEDPARKAWIDNRITTYLTDYQLCSSRIWAKIEFDKIKERFPDDWNQMIKLNTIYDVDEATEAYFKDKHSDFIMAMKKFVSNHRFVEAGRGAQ